MSRRPHLRLEDLTPEQRAAVDAFRARQATPEARAEDQAIREAVMQEFPPLCPSIVVMEAVARLRTERERLGPSLTDVSEASGIDPAKLENGKVSNPTFLTLTRYAQGPGKRLTFRLES